MAGADGSSWWRKSADTSMPAASRSNVSSSWTSQNRKIAAEDNREDRRSSASSTVDRQQHQQHQQHSQLSRAAAGAITSQLRAAPNPQELQRLLDRWGSQLTAPHISAALNALSNMTHEHPRVLEPLLRQQLLPALDSLIQRAEAATHLPSAAADSSGLDSSSMQQQQQPQLDSRSCAVVLQSLSRLQERSGLATPTSTAYGLLLHFLQPSVLQQAIPQGITMVTTAAAKLHIPARDVQLEQLLTALLDLEARRTADSCSRAQQLEPMYVSQTLWGVATMLAAQKRTPPNSKLLHLFQDVAALLTHPQLQLLQAAKPLEVCNTLSAFVIAELPASSLPSPGFAGELLGCLAALRHLRRASARDISRTLWAAAKLGAAAEAADCNALVAMFCSSEMLRSANAQVRMHSM